MYTQICIYIYIYIYVYTLYVYITHMQIDVYIYANRCVYIYIYIYITCSSQGHLRWDSLGEYLALGVAVGDYLYVFIDSMHRDNDIFIESNIFMK